MIIKIIDIDDIAIFESEDDSPVSAYAQRPISIKLSLEPVKI